jgi:hypothetical protein
MIRFVFFTALAVTAAIVGGAVSAQYAIERFSGINTITIGEWEADPTVGTEAADPYARARISRDMIIPLGAAEGLLFNASRDQSGQRLRRECLYRVAGNTPPARLWTLHAVTDELAIIRSPGRLVAGLHSHELEREDDGSAVISVSRRAQPGNWLAIEGEGPFRLVLTLYDTPIATSGAIAALTLPRIIREGCDG